MAETTNLNIRIDKELKEQAEVFFSELGLNMSSAFNIFVRQSLRQGKIPFELSIVADPFYSSTNMAVLRRSIQEANEGKFVVKTLDELRAMEEWKSALRKQDGKIINIGKAKIKKTLKQINKLIADIERNGYDGTGVMKQ